MRIGNNIGEERVCYLGINEGKGRGKRHLFSGLLVYIYNTSKVCHSLDLDYHRNGSRTVSIYGLIFNRNLSNLVPFPGGNAMCHTNFTST